MFMNFVVALIMCTIGFGKYSYFLSIGYGLSMSFMAFSTLVLFAAGRGYAIPAYLVIELVVLFIYGIKSSAFHFYRELKTPAPTKEEKLPIFPSVITMLALAAAFMVMYSPIVFSIKNGVKGTFFAWFGLVVALAGLAVSIVGDYHKSVQYKKNSNTFCCRGIFKYVRYPKYTGELLFWTGIFVSSWSGLKTFGQWLLVVLAYLVIIYVNLDAVKRAEKRHYAKFYEGDVAFKNEYMAYVAKTPIVIPFVKIYTFRDSSFIL